jgi:Domain of unknown function (DUF4352)
MTMKTLKKSVAVSAIALAAGALGACYIPGGGTPAPPGTLSPTGPGTARQDTTPPPRRTNSGVDGPLQFTVTGVKTARTMGSGFDEVTAKGLFEVVSMQVKDVSSTETGSFNRVNSDVLIDSTGRQYDSDYEAASADPNATTTTLQPGTWSTTEEVFDVPVGTIPSSVVVHGSTFSPGVRLDVTSAIQAQPQAAPGPQAPPPQAAPPSVTPDPEATAGQQLSNYAAGDAGFVNEVLGGNWVAQLSSKKVGTKDDGIVYDDQSILSEHLSLRDQYGAKLVAKGEYWVTVAPFVFDDSASATNWCHAVGRDADHCFATHLTASTG